MSYSYVLEIVPRTKKKMMLCAVAFVSKKLYLVQGVEGNPLVNHS